MLKEEEDDIEWITVHGVHIPIKPGEDKQDKIDKIMMGLKGKYISHDFDDKDENPRARLCRDCGIRHGKLGYN